MNLGKTQQPKSMFVFNKETGKSLFFSPSLSFSYLLVLFPTPPPHRRKCITTIQGLPEDLDLRKIARALKKTFQCNGTVNNDEELGEIIQLSGDQRTNVREFFVDQEVCHDDQIVIHGG
jgi:translation initiation factor 1 (eIF-1/SUI1)